MEIVWTYGGLKRTARIDAHVEPYVRALGRERAATFLLAMGGASAYFASRGRGVSQSAKLVGKDGERALAAELGNYINRVPVARAFLARYLSGKGENVAAIARTLRVSDVTVRSLLSGGSEVVAEDAS